MRTIQCPNCGAPVQSQPTTARFTCEYCGSLVEMDGDRPILLRTAQQTEAPKSSGAGGVAGCAVGLGGLLVVALVGVGIAVSVSGGPQAVLTQEVPWAELRAQPLSQSPAQLGEAVGVEPFAETSLYVRLADTPFDYASITWSEDHLDHVQGVYLGLDGETAPDPTVLAGLEPFWGSRLRQTGEEYRSFRWRGAAMMGSVDGTSLHIDADPDEDPDWAHRLDLLWTVLGAALAGEPPQVPEDEQVRWLALGHAPQELGALSILTPVDQAASVVQASFPDALVEKRAGLDLTVPLRMDSVASVELSWPNEEGGTLEDATLWPPDTSAGFTDAQALVSCLSAAWGAPEENVLDHLEGTRRYEWEPEGLTEVGLYPNHLSITVEQSWGRSSSQEGWTRFWEVLSGCEI